MIQWDKIFHSQKMSFNFYLISITFFNTKKKSAFLRLKIEIRKVFWLLFHFVQFIPVSFFLSQRDIFF